MPSSNPGIRWRGQMHDTFTSWWTKHVNFFSVGAFSFFLLFICLLLIDSFIYQLALGRVGQGEQKNYTGISISIYTHNPCTYRWMYTLYIFEEHFLSFHLILCRMNFWWLIFLFLLYFFPIFWLLMVPYCYCLIFKIIAIVFNLYFRNSSNKIVIWSSQERDIDLQTNKGNKIFSCHP